MKLLRICCIRTNVLFYILSIHLSTNWFRYILQFFVFFLLFYADVLRLQCEFSLLIIRFKFKFLVVNKSSKFSMPRCGHTCPKVQEQLRLLAQKAEARELEENNTIYNEPPADSEGTEVQTSDETSSISNVPSESTAPERDEEPTRSILASIPSSRGTAIIRSKSTRSRPSEHSQYRTSYRSLVGTAIVSNRSVHSSRPVEKELPETKSEQNQTEIDRYYLNKGSNYFEDFCGCSLDCVLAQVARDKFIRSTLASLAFFAFGIKLCIELDAWTIPNSFF
ncbi:uncharacterized protein LOC100677807 isoform X2 [Nasonia vitripennis]|uniref:Uncharacterized protein n=1 Tax=Nasonia vitripennis TaxID=7425 RepID=A0A7M7HF88_NASVI|nr:uncharacterized protein LOC100677807 isoform X2 [Nasonia vitripennis]